MYLDFERLEQLDPREFQHADPYPWVNPEGLLRPEAYDQLRAELPEVSEMDAVFGKARKGGQRPHDRYVLEYRDDTPLRPSWKGFVDELRGSRYRAAMCRLLGIRALSLNFHWHYTPNGCSVSPHCDAPRKLGSHIFYFNTEADWKPEWGGETVVLDDGGRFAPDSAPPFEAFDRAVASEALGNRSLIFCRRGDSWHGVREIRCPEDRMRKVFIVVLNKDTWYWRARHAVAGKDVQRY